MHNIQNLIKQPHKLVLAIKRTKSKNQMEEKKKNMGFGMWELRPMGWWFCVMAFLRWVGDCIVST